MWDILVRRSQPRKSRAPPLETEIEGCRNGLGEGDNPRSIRSTQVLLSMRTNPAKGIRLIALGTRTG